MTLDAYGIAHGTDKNSNHHGYLGNYEKHLASVRGSAFVLLEIGVASGASIRMWRDYFPFASVYGIDIDPNCAGDGIFIGDATDPVFLESVLEQIGTPYLVIDDGSHVGHDMIKTFRTLFPKVASGGLYAVEDTHCFYSETYSQGSGAFEFFSGLARDVDVAGRGLTGNTHAAIHNYSDPPLPEFSPILNAMHIYPSLWIFEKK